MYKINVKSKCVLYRMKFFYSIIKTYIYYKQKMLRIYDLIAKISFSIKIAYMSN